MAARDIWDVAERFESDVFHHNHCMVVISFHDVKFKRVWLALRESRIYAELV